MSRALTADHRKATHTRSDRGASIVELAVALPLIVLVLVGTVDFARVFYMAIELTNAARAGAQYGAFGPGSNSGDLTGMKSAAGTAAPNITGMTVDASRRCECATDNGLTYSSVQVCSAEPCASCSTICTGGTHPVTSVTVTAQKTFSTFASLPGIPSGFNVQRSATLRIAQ